MKRLVLTLCVVLLMTSLFAEKKGYEIKITVSDIPAEKVYLMGYYGNDLLTVDSALVSPKGSFVFASKNELPKGFYHVVDADTTEYMQLVVDQSSRFSVVTSMKDLKNSRNFKNTQENSTFFEFQKATMMTTLSPASRESVFRTFAEMSPNSLLSKFLRAMSRPAPRFRADTFYLCNHYFDGIDLNDARLLRVPMVPQKVMSYFEDVLPLYPDTMVKYVDYFLKMIDNKEVKYYYLSQLFDFYGDYVPNYDIVLAHLYDTYCSDGTADFLTESQFRVARNKVNRARKLLPGNSIPAIETYDAEGKILSTNDLKSKYLLLWFWDPDCDDCVELTPKLHDIFVAHAADYDFDVYAVALVDDYNQWQDFVKANELSWHNTSFAGGEPNYDLQDYFDVMTTPFIMLLDENRHIVAKQFEIRDLLKLMR
ncbi:MAG: DUF4369 domain-containing protein [Bacteroidales bacterium]|nr:DUF4369 domain-containing protein [Bacteroidales bacterium]